MPLLTGNNKTASFNFSAPVSGLSWCHPEKQEIVNIDGSDWKADVKLVASSSMCENKLDNCTYWNLVEPAKPDYFPFRVRSTYPGNNTHLSAVVQLSNQELFYNTMIPVWTPKKDDPLFPKTHVEGLKPEKTWLERQPKKKDQRNINKEDDAKNMIGIKTVVGTVLVAGATFFVF